MRKAKPLNIQRYNRDCQPDRIDEVYLPKPLSHNRKQIAAYQKALKVKKKAEAKLIKILARVYKLNDIDDILSVADIFNKLHISGCQFLYEKVYKLEEADKKKKKT